ncbi:hypothetical protein [Pseudomonas sp. PONIH3]|uniref:hypothetical protein n=1 Tax=Pseudomonas sp. PONIH3 TaxID=1636610 RepID=UPI000CDC3F57|nr:hypothetical protein [Pseudomonas sp. PONIH3]AUY33368.1 hypothetical protein C3F42_09150 [Pseudomonas sp. PONIH3]
MSTADDPVLRPRNVTIIDLSDVTTTILIPDSVVFQHVHRTNFVVHNLDVSSFCYKKRAHGSSGQIGDKVDPNSLDIHRLKIARIVIEFIRGQNLETAKTHRHWFNLFFTWIDANYDNISLDDINDLKMAYIGYTTHLIQRTQATPRSGNRITATVATNQQKAVAKLISIITGEELRIIKSWATKLNKSKPGIVKSDKPSSDEQDICFAAHINFLDEVHRVIVNNEPYPLMLTPALGEPYYLHDEIGYRKTHNVQLMYEELRKYPTLPPLDVLTSASADLSRLSDRDKALAYSALKKKVTDSNSANRNLYRSRNLVIMAMAAGFTSLIAATGSNSSVIAEVEPTDFKPLPTSKGMRMLGIKGRANGKAVSPEFGARYSSTYNKILELRRWLLGSDESPLLFPFPKRDGRYSTILAAHLQAYKSLLNKLMPNVRWVTPMEYRKNVSYQYLKLSNGDTLLTAQKLGNTVRTVESHYGRPSLEDLAQEFSAFFDAMQGAALARGRNQNVIPVKIIEAEPDALTIPGGSCLSAAREPTLASGFTSLSPTPSCREPEYCVFCQHYAVHADVTDLKRLLSIKFIIEASQPHYDSDRWTENMHPLQYRINEIIGLVTEQIDNPSLIKQVEEQVSSGELDPFWATHLDALVYMGYVS